MFCCPAHVGRADWRHRSTVLEVSRASGGRTGESSLPSTSQPWRGWQCTLHLGLRFELPPLSRSGHQRLREGGGSYAEVGGLALVNATFVSHFGEHSTAGVRIEAAPRQVLGIRPNLIIRPVLAGSSGLASRNLDVGGQPAGMAASGLAVGSASWSGGEPGFRCRACGAAAACGDERAAA